MYIYIYIYNNCCYYSHNTYMINKSLGLIRIRGIIYSTLPYHNPLRN